jgi:hypothetical protein
LPTILHLPHEASFSFFKQFLLNFYLSPSR